MITSIQVVQGLNALLFLLRLGLYMLKRNRPEKKAWRLVAFGHSRIARLTLVFSFSLEITSS
jgi:hypothetical protein